MSTIERLNHTTTPHFYSGDGDLSEVDLQVFCLTAFLLHLAALETALRARIMSAAHIDVIGN